MKLFLEGLVGLISLLNTALGLRTALLSTAWGRAMERPAVVVEEMRGLLKALSALDDRHVELETLTRDDTLKAKL